MLSILRTAKQKLNYRHFNIPKINKEPWFILGNPKSGTSAIAQLLSKASNSSLTLDFTRAINNHTLQLELRYSLLSFDDFIKKYALEFSHELIKEPFLTFFTEELFKHFPNANYLFIIRNPYQNIRSILNRLKIPGDLQNIDFFQWEELNRTPAWKTALQSEMIGFPSSNYIESMAHRWNFAINTYLKNKNQFILIRYEDFNLDKEKYIYELCKNMRLNVVNDISEDINIQYQPKGQEGDIKDFFNKQNLKKIEHICGKNMKKLGY